MNRSAIGSLATAVLVAAALSGCDEREPDRSATPGATSGAKLVPVKAASTVATKENAMDKQVATFGAGCFWGVEAAFRQVEGVTATAVGYAGGKQDNPTYKQVCTDDTGHAEVVQVEFDPAAVSYEQLLDVFWRSHDPTQVNRQGPDVGTQYRSIVFFHSPEQESAARASKDKLASSDRFRRPIATEIVPAATFWKAEEYHQQYLEKRGQQSCHTTFHP